MNGINKITARIHEDAQADCTSLLREAKTRAAAIKADYEAKAKTAADAAAAKADADAAQRLERLEGAARMDAKKLLLSTKQDCIRQAFDRAQDDLLALSENDYVALLAKIVVKASQTGQEEIIFSARDRERVGEKVVAEANRLRSGTVLPFGEKKADASTLEDKVKNTLRTVGNAVVTTANQLKTGTAFTLSEETRDITGGLILKDGNIEINCAFETQLRLLWESMAGEVASLLFS